MHDQQLYMQVRLSAARRFLTSPLQSATRRRPVRSLSVHAGCHAMFIERRLHVAAVMCLAELAMHWPRTDHGTAGPRLVRISPVRWYGHPQAMAAATGKVPGDDWTVVTGSNRGLGYGVAKHLVEQGRGVVMAARTQSSGRAAAGSSLCSNLGIMLSGCCLPRSSLETCVVNVAAGCSVDDQGGQCGTPVRSGRCVGAAGERDGQARHHRGGRAGHLQSGEHQCGGAEPREGVRGEAGHADQQCGGEGAADLRVLAAA